MSETKRPRRSSRHFSGKDTVTPELSETIRATLASLKDFADPEVVIGNGWAAMMTVGFLATKVEAGNILWVTNSGARAVAPLPLVESGVAAGTWRELLHRLGVSQDEPQSGHYLREFRHRSFARAAWHKAPTREARHETLVEWLWGPESRITPIFEARFDASLAELEEKIRERIAALPNVKILAGVPVTGFEGSAVSLSSEGSVKLSSEGSVKLSSGDAIPFRRAIWADRWVGLGAIEGLPKGSALARNREPMGILQAVFTHSAAMVDGSMQEAFFGSTHKDAGEDFNRNVWGSFFDGGKKSVWTIFTTEEEGADNHTIGKKYRRLRQALDKMFTGTEWLPEGVADFSATIVKEQLLFQEDFIFATGATVHEAQSLGGVTFVTDAFGPSAAAEQVASALGAELGLDLAAMANAGAGPALDSLAPVAAEEGGSESQDVDAESSASPAEPAELV